jgi:tRNA A-37 threonylcarbamoyl transferase component Bud32
MMTEVTEVFVNELYNEVFGKSPDSIEQITGLGFVNQVYKVNLCDEINIIRLRKGLRTYNEFLKEKFCIEQADKAGILTAKVICVDKYNDVSFIVQSYIDGVNGSLCPDKSELIWTALGKYAKLLHSVDVKGYGFNMKNYGVFHNYAVDVNDYVDVSDYFYNSFNPTLQSHIEYHVNCINQEDEFIKLGIYALENINQIKEAFISLLDMNFELGLIHGDMAAQNIIINNDKVYLIDFGGARVGIIPFDEFIWLNGNTDEEFKIFREAYGMSNETFARNERQFRILYMLNVFDILRWSIYHGGDNPYAVYAAKKSLSFLLQT